jgi:methionyl-tRNA synthetase
MKNIEIRKATSELRSIWTLGNEYLQIAAPWSHFKENPGRAACIVRFSFNLIALYSNISRPFIPDTAEKIDLALQLNSNISWPVSLTDYLNSIKKDHKFSVPDNLFEKLSDQTVSEFKHTFSGTN